MVRDKKPLNIEEMTAQTALELPNRELLSLVTVVITNLLNGNTVNIPVSDVNVGNGICAQVLASSSLFSCKVIAQ